MPYQITKPGIYYDVPPADYHQDCCPAPSFTQSLAKVLLAQSPGHARLEHPKLGPGESEPENYAAAKAIGTAAHMLMLGRGAELVMIESDSFRTKAAQDLRDDALEAGKTPILAKHYDRAFLMVVEARDQIDAAGWASSFRDGKAEVVIAWQEHGIWFRSMIDWMSGLVCTDYKTTMMSCAPHMIGRLAVDAGWDVQAAMHERGLAALDPASAGRRKWRFVAQEQYPPYALTCVELNEHWLTIGRKKLDRAIEIWRRCMETGDWPLYPTATITPEYPAYLEARWLEREIAAEEHQRAISQPFDNLIMAG